MMAEHNDIIFAIYSLLLIRVSFRKGATLTYSQNGGGLLQCSRGPKLFSKGGGGGGGGGGKYPLMKS